MKMVGDQASAYASQREGLNLKGVVTRSGDSDVMTLPKTPRRAQLQSDLAAALRAVTKLGGNVELVGAGSLPNDGKVISDER